MHPSKTSLAQLAAANAAVIMREMPADDGFEHHLSAIDFITNIAVKIAVVEAAAADFWNDREWESVCANIAKWLVANKTEMPDAILAKLLGVPVRALR